MSEGSGGSAGSAGSVLVLGGAGVPLTAAEPGRWDRVEVVVADRLALRGLRLPGGLRAATVVVRVTVAPAALTLVPRPEWPPLLALRTRREDDGSWVCVLRFGRRLKVADVVAELGRQSVWHDVAGHGGLVTDSPRADVAPDVSPAVVRELSGPLAIGPLDERVLNPVGFAGADSPVVDLASVVAPDPQGSLEALVVSLRGAAGVEVDGSSQPRVVAALAMAGVPLTGVLDPATYGAPVAAAAAAPVDLADPVAREEHSIVLRRAALRTFSSFAWRRAVGERVGVRVATQPRVSVVLATRRPALLEHALAQVARQRGVEALELVLAPHGFTPDPAQVAALAGVPVQVLPQPADAVFGDVLAAAVAAAGGDVVLKLDDDDWYAPDVVADLLLARAYSGAELVGMPPELHYLAPTDTTVRRGHPSELYTRFVAGGTLLVDRGLLRSLGSFRSVPRSVDAQLLHAVVSAGGAVYRTHGLGYVMRRDPGGHTWEIDLAELQDPAANAAIVPGFVPGRLLEL